MNAPTVPPDPADDTTIRSECQLLRRIHQEWVVPDENAGDKRISSQGFKDPTMSIHNGDDLAAGGHKIEEVLDKYPEMDLAAITAGSARHRDQKVYKQHDPEELCHGVVEGKKSGATSRAFAQEATRTWLIRRNPS